MKTETLGHDADAEDCGIEVYDPLENRHVVTVGWDGTVLNHAQESYPHDPADRTDKQEAIMRKVQNRALYEAQREFPEQSIREPPLRPWVIERAVEAVQQMDTERFEREFREFYEAVTETAAVLPDGVPLEKASCVKFAFTITPDNEYGESGNVDVLYLDDDGYAASTAGPNDFPEDADYVDLYFPPAPFDRQVDHPEDFFAEVQGNLAFQIRDLYEGMGEEPPETYQLDGYRIYPVPGEDRWAVLD